MKRRRLLFGLATAPILLAVRALAREPIIGLPCEGCDDVFYAQPPDLASRTRIASIGEPGVPMSLYGRVFDEAGVFQPGVIVYAYHTDRSGKYPPIDTHDGSASTRHGRLRAWAVTDTRGEYRFDTIRPGSYPGRDIPEHIHMHVIEPGRATYYIDDVMFTDDPKLTRQQVARLTHDRGGSGVATPEWRDDAWLVRRDIFLGLGIDDYPAAKPA